MAQCGIKKYDSLPGRVGFIDVDAARAALSSSFKRIESLKQKPASSFLFSILLLLQLVKVNNAARHKANDMIFIIIIFL